MTESLRRSRPTPDVRALHLGLGNFFRAHQAWYTQHAGDWGIAAFTGRSPRAAEVLRGQDCLYTLDVRGDDDHYEVIEALAAAHAADEQKAWTAYWTRPEVQVLTMTVTEAGYHPSAQALTADVQTLRSGGTSATAPGRLLEGMRARMSAAAGPITLVPCDNLPSNGEVLRGLLTSMGAQVDPDLVPWITTNAFFVSTMVDRITPAATDDDRLQIAQDTGFNDASPVVTEAFSEWVLSDTFGTPHPEWVGAGAVITDDVAPYEARKLTLLNAAHSLLAYLGQLRGHLIVSQAIADPVCEQWVQRWWAEASPHVPMPDGELQVYRASLLRRWRNPGIAHTLTQIGMDGSQKLAARLPTTIHAERAAGRMPQAACQILAAWIVTVRQAHVNDPQRARLLELGRQPLSAAVRSLVGVIDPSLIEDDDLVGQVIAQVAALDTTHGN